MIDVRKLIAWIEASPGATVELLFAQVGGGDDPDVMCLCTWEAPYQVAAVVDQAIEIAQQDCDAQRARCAYQLKLEGKRTTYRRIALTPRAEERPLDGPTEPATPAGLAAQMMRHREIELRAGVGTRVDVGEGWKEVLKEQREFTAGILEHFGKLQEREIKTVEMYGALRAKDQEFQLKILQLGASNDRVNNILEKVVAPLVPGLAAQLRGLPVAGGGAPGAPPAPGAPTPGSVPTPPGAPTAPASPASPAPDAGPMATFRDLAMLLVSHDVDPAALAETVASTVPEGESRDRAKALVLQTVRGALTS